MRSDSTSLVEAMWRKRAALTVVLVFVAPVGVLLARGTTRFSWELLLHLCRTVLPVQLGYSLLVAVGTAVFTTCLAAGGMSCAIFEFPGRAVLHRLLLVPLLIPAWFLAVIYLETMGLSGVGGLIAVLAVSAAPFLHLFVTAALRSIPGSYQDVLRVFGGGHPRQVVCTLGPLSFPALGAACATVMLLAWSDSSAARTMAVPTVTVGLLDQWYGREDSSVGVLFGLVVAAASALSGLLLWVLLRRIGWSDRAGLHPISARRTRLWGWRGMVPWLLCAPQVVGGVVVPWVVIGTWSAERLHRVNLGYLGADCLRTLLVAGLATICAGALALPILQAQQTGRSPRLNAAMGGLTLVAVALPPPVLGLSVLWMLPNGALPHVASPINASALPLIAALAIRFGGVYVAAVQAAAARQARDHCSIMRVLGHTDASSFIRLLRPYLARAVSAASAFVFLESLQDISLPLMLQPFGFNTISTRVYQYAQTQQIRECAVWVLCLALLGVYPLFTLARICDSRQRRATG